MDRLSRYINNQKQDKIRIVQSQPSKSTLREGQEVLFQGKNKPLRRYRKENGILWSADMSRDGNQYVDKNIYVENDIVVKGFPVFKNLPAFSAFQSASSDDEVYATATFTRITFDTELYDNSANYASNAFTAPVNGIYHFSVKLFWDPGGVDTIGDWSAEDQHQVALYKNESNATTSSGTNKVSADVNLVEADITDKFLMNSLTVDLKLDKGDYISAYAYHDSGHNQRSYSTNVDDFTQFNGHLITAL
jgi:hypothetical protein